MPRVSILNYYFPRTNTIANFRELAIIGKIRLEGDLNRSVSIVRLPSMFFLPGKSRDLMHYRFPFSRCKGEQ